MKLLERFDTINSHFAVHPGPSSSVTPCSITVTWRALLELANPFTRVKAPILSLYWPSPTHPTTVYVASLSSKAYTHATLRRPPTQGCEICEFCTNCPYSIASCTRPKRSCKRLGVCGFIKLIGDRKASASNRFLRCLCIFAGSRHTKDDGVEASAVTLRLESKYMLTKSRVVVIRSSGDII
jgi:hypothetical protein